MSEATIEATAAATSEAQATQKMTDGDVHGTLGICLDSFLTGDTAKAIGMLRVFRANGIQIYLVADEPGARQIGLSVFEKVFQECTPEPARIAALKG